MLSEGVSGLKAFFFRSRKMKFFFLWFLFIIFIFFVWILGGMMPNKKDPEEETDENEKKGKKLRIGDLTYDRAIRGGKKIAFVSNRYWKDEIYVMGAERSKKN